jgi:signal transduction histidine kinase
MATKLVSVQSAQPSASRSSGPQPRALTPAAAGSIVLPPQRERTLMDAIRTPIITASPDGRIISCNVAATALLGSSAPVLGQPIDAILPLVAWSPEPSDQPRIWAGRIEHAGSHALDVEITETELAAGAGPADRLYVLHDISQHAELNRLREQLLYSVAHELRAPMALLENTLDIVASEYGSFNVQEFDQLIGSARRTSLRLRTLMDDLLSAGDIQSGRFMVSLRPAELSAILDGAVETVDVLLGGRGQRVERTIARSAQHVMADPRYLRQILSNLLANASKYGPRDSAITVSAERLGHDVRIAVGDRGPGIPSEQQAGLFDRFYRVRPGNEEPGIGLGLAIVKGIVAAHGGTVGIDSATGEGTQVWFTLQRAGPGAGRGAQHGPPVGAGRKPQPRPWS